MKAIDVFRRVEEIHSRSAQLATAADGKTLHELIRKLATELISDGADIDPGTRQVALEAMSSAEERGWQVFGQGGLAAAVARVEAADSQAQRQ